MKRDYLKIKVVSLAAESKLIRDEEKKLKWKLWAARGRANFRRDQANLMSQPYVGPLPEQLMPDEGLYLHRVKDVRRESRSANIAYGFVRGRRYDQIERFSWTQPDWNRVKRLATKYTDKPIEETEAQFDAWMTEALRGCRPYLVERDLRHPGSRKMFDEWTNSRIGSNSRNAA